LEGFAADVVKHRPPAAAVDETIIASSAVSVPAWQHFTRRQGSVLSTSAFMLTLLGSSAGAARVLTVVAAYRKLLEQLSPRLAAASESKEDRPDAARAVTETASLTRLVETLQPFLVADEKCCTAFERFVGERSNSRFRLDHRCSLVRSAVWDVVPSRQGERLPRAWYARC
jgi:hypothetical protein